MTEGLNILFGPKNLNIKQENRNGSHIVHVHFESNPVPASENVTFVIERRTDCGQEVDVTQTCQPRTLTAGSVLNNFNASALENKVSIMTVYCLVSTTALCHIFFIKTKSFRAPKSQKFQMILPKAP